MGSGSILNVGERKGEMEASKNTGRDIKKQRIEFVDLAKGFCISSIVLLHVLGDSAEKTSEMLYQFTMPLFFILSGLFFKSYSGLKEFLKRKLNKLIVPFLFAYVFVCMPSILLFDRNLSINSFYDIQSLKPCLGINGAAWFLLCLFIQNVMFYLVYKYSRQNNIVIACTSVAVGLCGYMLSVAHVHLPVWTDSAMTALPFFTVGYFIRNNSAMLTEKNGLKCLPHVIVAAVALALTCVYNQLTDAHVLSYGDNTYTVNPVCLYWGG